MLTSTDVSKTTTSVSFVPMIPFKKNPPAVLVHFLHSCELKQEKRTKQKQHNNMKLSAITALLAVGLFMDGSLAFQSQPSLSTQQRSSSLYGYVPSGFTPEQYKKFKAQEDKKKQKKKNLGSMGPKGFQSRSFQSFQEALEKGEATHLMPVLDAEKRIKSGELKREDIPVSGAFLRQVNHDLIVQFD